MKLIGFKIQNVKSIIDSGWCYTSEKDNLTVFAGQNEAGKTAILEGLNFFKNGATPTFIEMSKRTDQTFPRVECEFLLEPEDLNASTEIASILKELKKIKLVRGDVLKASYDAIYISPDSLVDVNTEITKFIGLETALHEEAEASADSTTTGPTSTVPADPTAQAVPDPSPEPPSTPDGLLTELTQHYVNHLPIFILYDSFDNYLPAQLKLSEIDTYQAVKDFQIVYKFKFADFKTLNHLEYKLKLQEINDSATVDFNDYWNQKLTNIKDIEDKYNYELEYIPSDATPDDPTIRFSICKKHSPPLYIAQKSKGFRWFSSFYLRLKALAEEITPSQKIILLIDEPGQGLHETAQSDVKKVLEELGKKKDMQVLYSTHNPCLIGITDGEILRIRLVFQEPKKGTKINNITQRSTGQSSMDALSPIISAMGINSVGTMLDRAIPSVALEGLTDHYYFTAMRKVLGVTEEYSFVPAVGVTNIRPLVSILIGWGGVFKAIFDGDKHGEVIFNELKDNLYPNDPEEFAKHILMLPNAEGIEDLFSHNDFDNYIMNKPRTDATAKNSAIAKKTKKKELMARLFLETVDTSDPQLTFEPETVQNFKAVFDWLKGPPTTV